MTFKKIKRAEKLSCLIKDKAKDIGFDLAGICSAKPFNRAYKVLIERKKKEDLSIFTNQDIRLLTTPKLHLPEARSIIAVALSYANKNYNNNQELFISSYTQGLDYHMIMKKKLNLLIDYIKTLSTDLKYKAYSDTGAILDREIAYRAGIGWIGKNNNIINPEYGSYIFLGEIITNLELIFDKKINNNCGNCTLCIDNCPGKALQKNNYFIPDNCLSNITQEKGIISDKKRKLIGNSLWGCDRCQDVCPYNKNIPLNIHPEFYPDSRLNLKTILDLNNKELKERINGKALSWQGTRILKRNAIIIIANKKLLKYKDYISKYLDDNSPILRYYAVWALGELNQKNDKQILMNMLNKEKDTNVKLEINKSLKKIKMGG